MSFFLRVEFWIIYFQTSFYVIWVVLVWVELIFQYAVDVLRGQKNGLILRVHLYRDFSPHGRKIGCHFLSFWVFQGFDLVFNQIIVGNDVFYGSNRYGTEKKMILSPETRLRSSKTFENSQKTMKMTPKMTETIRGTCGGQRGTVGDRFGVTYEGSWSNQKPENSFETRLCSSKTIKNRLKSSKNDVFDDLLRTFGSFWVNFQHMKWLLIGSVSFRNTKKIIQTMIITVFTT